MKTLFVILLVAAIAGAVSWQRYQINQKPTIAQQAAALAERTQQAALQARETVAAKADEWKLNPEVVREELVKTGRVVRSRTISAGERMDDVRIVTVIKGKYVVEKDLSVFDISVECTDGEVKLEGTVMSADQISQAVGLALQTTGVRSVVSHLALRV